MFEEKTSWALEFEEAMWEDVVSDNYPSAKENEKDIRRQVIEEVQEAERERGYGEVRWKTGGGGVRSRPQRAELKVRLIHDGTY